MSNTTLTQLQEGLTTAYIDGTAAANLAYKPAFVSNNPEEGKKVISVIEDELMKCDQFVNAPYPVPFLSFEKLR